MTPWIFDWAHEAFDLSPKVTYPVLMRSVGSFIVAFFFVFVMGRRTANWLYRQKIRDRVREYGEFFSSTKSGTPTMGGILMIGGVMLAAIIFSDLRSRIPALLCLTTLFFGGVGALDDYLKVRRGSSDGGLSRGVKFGLQIGYASILAILLSSDGSSPFAESIRTQLFLPFPGPDKVPPFDLGWAYGPFVVFAIVAIANAINFADGLDGLAVLPCGLTAAVFGLFAYLMWHHLGPKAFDMTPIPGMQEVAIYAAAVVGACFGFLWFNGYPANMFMGDTGSQALGGTLALLAILAKQELLFLIAGGLFVYEAFSVLYQDYIGIRWLGRRFFFRAPAHHSFQYRGIAETKVVVRFWIVGLICAVLSVATLRLR